MRRPLEYLGLGFLVCLPLFLLYWVWGGTVHFGDEIFGQVAFYLFGKHIYGAGLLFLLLLFFCIGLLFNIPYIGPLLSRILRPVPFIGTLLQQKDHFYNIREQWKSSGCGPVLVSLYRDRAVHPAAITKVFLTDFGYLAVIGVASFPPQELYYFDDDVVYYGLPASEITIIHMTLGFSAKRTDLRGVLKRATIKELVERYHLYRENRIKESGVPVATQ